MTPTVRERERVSRCDAVRALPVLSLLFSSASSYGAGAIDGDVERQALNPTAIVMFLVFVAVTLGISYWASRRTHSSKDFYTAGGGISGLQNGTAIAGDFMSAASFWVLRGLFSSEVSMGWSWPWGHLPPGP